MAKITPIVQERIGTLDEAPEIAGFFFEEQVHPKLEELVGKKMTYAESAAILKKSLFVLEGLAEVTAETAEPPMRALVEASGLSAGQVFGILRTAVTGQTVSPPLFESMAIIGREKVLERIAAAEKILSE